MAGYAALVSLSQVLKQILYSDQHRDVVGPNKEQIKQLHKNVIFLLTFLEDFPGETGNLEARITTAANQAEDIIEYYMLYELRPTHGMHFCNFLNWLRHVNLFLPSTEPAGHQIVAYTGLKHQKWQSSYIKLHESIKEIDSILKEMMQIKSSSRDLRLNHYSGSSSSSSRLASKGKDTVVGFEEDLMEIKSRLYGEPSKLQIIPIVGMGGIGKTTLARFAHNDPLIVQHFDFRAWVTVSQDYHARRILLSLFYSIDASNKEKHEKMEDELKRKYESNEEQYKVRIDELYELLVASVYKYLKGRRYLIVMDDMWNTNVWDDVRRIFPDDFNGSRIIVTTRESDVASYAGSSSHPYQIQLMDKDQSWRLLREKVFGQEDCPPGLEKIGKLIAENCRGLPLAIVVIAGVLSKVKYQIQETWKDIATNVNKAVNKSDEQFLEILSLSYTHLPHYLRPCFLYMGGFPEDQEIKVSKLIKYWVAEGFLKSNRSKDLEETAEEYLEELAKRSLILVVKKRFDGKIKAVKIHDLLRDLCLKKARDENFLRVMNEFSCSSSKGIRNSRRLSNLSKTWRGFLNIYGSPIRTIIFFHPCDVYSLRSFRLLRVLDAMCVELASCPVEIGDLFHLRYLAFSFGYGFMFEVLGSLSKLQNLQTLILRRYTLSLPPGIWRMPQLRHLILSGVLLPDPCIGTPEKILALENLHTLLGVTCFTCSQRILEMIPNLKKLGIIYSSLGLVNTGWSKYCLKNLVHLQKLEKLKFDAVPYGQGSLSQNLAFPRTLKKLTLVNCGIKWKDMQNIVGPLPNLEVLKLKQNACHGTKWETTEGEFRQLKVLLIDSALLQYWITESDHFPTLERLLLYDCPRLREIPLGIGEIPTLQLIEVDLDNLSLVESAKCIEEEQRSYGNDDLQVHFRKSRHWSGQW